jgi:hypothetical protein
LNLEQQSIRRKRRLNQERARKMANGDIEWWNGEMINPRSAILFSGSPA